MKQGFPQRSARLENRRFRLRSPGRSAALLFVVALATVVTAAAMEIQAGVTAYVSGEGHWSRARQLAVDSLYRYSLDGRPGDLQRARDALLIPMGDRDARMALEKDPPDIAVAWRGFRAGGNAEHDIARLVWMHRLFSRAPFFRDAIRVWREAEPHIIELVAITDELELRWSQPGSVPSNADLRRRIDALSLRLAPLEREFSALLMDGSRWVRGALLLASALSFLLISAITIGVHAANLRGLRESEARFRASFEQATIGIAELDADGVLLAVNDELASMLQRDPAQLCGQPIDAVLAAGSAGISGPAVLDATRSGAIERQVIRNDGSMLWIRLTASRIGSPELSDPMVFLVVENISEARRLAESLAFQASHDSLTGLINRREVERRLENLLRDAQATDGRHTLCFLDLDQFKLVNDTSSHTAGDHLLRLVAATLPARLRPNDWAGRLGGDEFAVLFADTPAARGAELAEGMNRALADTSLLWEGRHFSLTSSIGVVEINRDTTNVAALLRAGDAACYLAKDAGRNRVRVHADGDRDVARRHDEMVWANHARAAIAEGRLRLHAQRIESLRPGTPPAGLQYEVLVRMVDMAGNLCHPDFFLAAAERFGLAPAVDAKVLTMTLELLARHPAHVAALQLCHINVSGQSAASPSFRQQVEAALDASEVPAERVCFELTETAPDVDLVEVGAFIAAVRRRGCRVALDDFGSGMASFAYLRQLPIDIVKIDGQFVRDLGVDPFGRSVVNAMVGVARALGKATIAEWAETSEVVDHLRTLGVDAAQGFALHRPCPIEELLRETSATSAAGFERPGAARGAGVR
jgi:diguanylate cyclase (GGDEF)-like protein/PAS domain S-box-containing protein